MHLQFGTRPTLRSVIAQLLDQLIAEKTAPLDTPAQALYVAFPNRLGGYDVSRLVEAVLDYLADGKPPDVQSRVDDRLPHLVDVTKRKVGFARAADSDEATWPRMTMLDSVIRQIPGILYIAFQEALATYWDADGSAGTSRWQWLGDRLAEALHVAAIRQASVDAKVAETLTQVVNHPDRLSLEAVSQVRVHILESRVSRGTLSTTLLSPDLLVTLDQQVLHCRLSGAVVAYASMEAFVQAWQRELSLQFDAHAIKLKRYEPSGNFFDTQAALLLNQQLEDLAAIQLPSHTSKAELQTLFSRVTDPAAWFSDVPGAELTVMRRLQTALPGWLSGAMPTAQLAYGRHSLELARVRQASQGKLWSHGIDTLRVYAARQLHQQMLLDQPQAPGYQPDELELTFAVPVGTLSGGYIERQTMSLTELALRNLSGKPKGEMTIRHTGGQLIQAWTTPDYLLDLIRRVDIGQAYPQALKNRLLRGSADATERQQLFGNELRVMLPLTALELAVKGELGFTMTGYRFIAALVQTSAVEQIVGEDSIVIRPLALRRKPGADPDQVEDMFIIERAGNSNGPHLLYRPMYRQPLEQFPDRAAMLAAIVAPGELQESVLAWLPDRARSVYEHGGLSEPHIVHFSPLDPFGVPDKPKPATLAADASDEELIQSLQGGELMQNLFGRHVRALVDLADRESVSNAESRWAIMLEGGWLLFNALLALPLSVPVLLAGWMVSLTSSLAHDIPGLESTDPVTQEQAVVDLLLNIALVLLHAGTAGDVAKAREAPRYALALDPIRRASTQPLISVGPLDQGTIALPSEPPGGGHTLLAFDKSVARDASAARLFERLKTVRVEWPKQPLARVDTGAFKGLFKLSGKWHASVAGLLFQVEIVAGFGDVFIVHPQKPDHPGIKLRTDGNGHWTLDRGLRLEGGGPKKRIAAYRQALEDRTAPLIARTAEIGAQLNQLTSVHDQAFNKTQQARAKFEADRTELINAWNTLQRSASPTTRELQLHRLWQEKTRATQVAFEVALAVMQRNVNTLLPLQRQLLDSFNQIRAVDRAPLYEEQQLSAMNALSRIHFSLRDLLHEHLRDVAITAQGEHIDALTSRSLDDLAREQTSAYEAFIGQKKREQAYSQALIECTQRIETLWDEMARLSPAGSAQSDKLHAGIRVPELFYAANYRIKLLSTYVELALDRSCPAPDQSEWFFLQHLNGTPFYSALIAHLQMRIVRGFTLQEQVSVYENVIAHYESQAYAMRSLHELGSDALRRPYPEQFLECLAQARSIAEEDLATVIHALEQTRVSVPKALPLKSKPASKRVFKARDHGTLVGDVRAQSSTASEAIIDLHDPQTGAVRSTFHEHPREGVYVEVVGAPPAARPSATRSASAAIKAGKRLRQERLNRERLIEREKSQLSDPVLREEKNPQEWFTLLEQLADELGAIIAELERVRPVTEPITAAIEGFRAEALDLRNAGRRYRNDGYKRQSPTPDKVFTLWRDNQLDIQLIQARKVTSAQDFLSEYAIREKASNKVLWYAHFHYAKKTDADLAYVAAHLKRADQRYVGLKAQLQQAKDNQAVVRIWRSRVSPEMARKLFFYSA
ncbi:hypothetical protein VRB78_10930 [Pseudomonas trivialis]|uniref:hypothetical protein n=1 Tax=Pseudomonas trivialis TaxID=200450 RepID=UPI0030D239B4